MRRAVLLAATLAVPALVAACGDTDDGGEGAIVAMVRETCAPTGDPLELEVCECAYRELRERFDAEELEDLDRELRDDPETVPPEVQEVVLDCAFAPVAPPTVKPTSTTLRPTSTTSTSTTTSTTRRFP